MVFDTRCRAILLGIALALAGPAALGQQAADADLLAARDAALRGQWKIVEAARGRLAGHVLEAYPSYWLLAGTLDRSDPREVQAFLARYPSSPLAESLRREWLKALGAAASWEVFRAELPKLATDDAEIACYALQERLSRGDADAVGEARALFHSSRETPGACEPVFAALAGKRLSDDEIWGRIRMLLAASHLREAKRTNALLPKRVAFSEKSVNRAAADPSAFLAREKSALVGRGSKEIVVFALARVARNHPEEAAERLALFKPRLGTAATQFAWGQVAWHAAMNHHPRALDYYALAGDTPLTASQLAWRARAAMRAGDWKAVLAAIQALAPEESRESTWRYWRARAWKQLGAADASTALLRSVARELDFYGLLAAEELGMLPAPDWKSARPTAAELDAIRAVPGIQRALVLYRAGLDNEAFREWIWAIRGLDDRSLLGAAEVARLANVADRAIGTADRTVQIHDFTQRYPIPHREALASAAKQWSLDESMVYSIIRQESRFMPEARSRAGARGLMQLMPATARWVARQIPVQPYRQDMLAQPEVNIHMGAYYLRRVLDDLGHPILAAAAYNAGPGRARRWRDERALEGAIYVETIPFNETRDYVKKVFANAWFYHHRLDGRPASLRQLLGTVAGRSADPPGAVAANIP